MSNDSLYKWFRYIIKSTFLWSFFDRLLTYFRQIRIIRIIFSAISYAVTFLGTGVAFVVFATVVLFILPFIALCTILLIFASILQRKKVCEKMEQLLAGKNVLVFFWDRGATTDNFSFGKKVVLDHASSENCVSIIISPYLVSAKGINKNNAYISVREEYRNVFTVRKYVYFDLKKRVLKRKCLNTIFFY